MMKMFPLTSCLLSLVSLGMIGCGAGGDRPSLGEVTGMVTLNGAPLGFATVEFMPAAGGRTSVGVTEMDGTYELVFSGDVKGAAVGSHQVRITSKIDAESGEDGAPDIVANAETVPQQYNDDTTLNVEVKSGPNTHNFDLTGERGPEQSRSNDA